MLIAQESGTQTTTTPENPFGNGFVPATDNFSQGSLGREGALSNLETMISNGITALTVLAGIFFIFYFFMGAFFWISAGGDSGKVQKARDQMINATIGLIVVVAAYAVVGLIGTVVGLPILTPAATLRTIIPPAPGTGN
jgi:magnesium-transporting ATPase (P-type)